MPDADLITRLDALLPQTQCRQCGYAGCRPYAEAMAAGEANANQCPPGGDEGARALAAALDRPFAAVDPRFGVYKPPALAVIDEARCIGCTLCIKACPVDAVIGTNKHLHTVIEADCTGCELCIPVCPVDCISLEPAHPAPEPTGWAAWTPQQADAARTRYERRTVRLQREKVEHDARMLAKAEHKLAHLAEESRLTDPVVLDTKRAAIEAALARARARRQGN